MNCTVADEQKSNDDRACEHGDGLQTLLQSRGCKQQKAEQQRPDNPACEADEQLVREPGRPFADARAGVNDEQDGHNHERDADRIVVIKEGEIAEIGKHPELITAGGYYASLVTRQTEGFLEETERAA